MSRSVAALKVGLGVALSITAFVGPARAADPDLKKVCIDADTQGQSLRRAGKLVDARAALKACLDARCPEIVRTDCNERMDELSRVQPTVVVEAKDGKGADLSAVTVYVDGTKVADALGGEALPIDPGPHDLRFETPGADPVTHHLILREGDRGRREAVVFGGGAQAIASGAAVTPPPEPPPPPPEPGHGQRIAGIAVGVGGVAILGAGIVFGLVAQSQWNDAQSACKPGCGYPSGPRTEASHAKTYATLSTVGYIAGGVLAAGGAVLYFTAPKTTDSGPASAQLGLSLGGAVLRGTF